MQWIRATHTVKNSTVDFLCSLTGRAQDPLDLMDQDNGSYEMDAQCEREFRRTVGLDDTETVADLGTQKPTRTKEVPVKSFITI